MPKTIAIDGPSGAGKSSVARMLSEILGFEYLDTGAMYRTVALGLLKAGIETTSTSEEIESALAGLGLSFSGGRAYLQGQDVSDEIRSPEIGHFASVFSTRAPVREFLKPLQKKAAEHGDLVAEGRDMTTVIFPEAWLKIYLDADMESRARRRYNQLWQGGVKITMERAKEDVMERDERDSSRDLAPLKVAPDAVYIETSSMTVEEVIKKMLGLVRKME